MIGISSTILSQNSNLKFDKNVNITIDDNFGLFNSDNSLKIFNEFINKNSIIKYDTLHSVTKGNVRLQIIILKSKSSEWRLTKFESFVDGDWIIKELRIEK